MAGDWRKNLILGNRCAICPRCGHAQRYLEGTTAPRSGPCPDCGTAMIAACPTCDAPIESAMQVDCRVCAEPLRPAEAFGRPIRRKREPPPAP